MPLLLKPETVRVDLPTPGEWVDVKRRLSKGDQTRIAGAAFKLRAGVSRAGAADVDAAIDYEATVFTGLDVGIVSWSFSEPVTPQNIRALDQESYDVIAAACNELWEPRKEEDRKNSSGNGAPPSSEEDASPLSSDG